MYLFLKTKFVNKFNQFETMENILMKELLGLCFKNEICFDLKLTFDYTLN